MVAEHFLVFGYLEWFERQVCKADVRRRSRIRTS